MATKIDESLLEHNIIVLSEIAPDVEISVIKQILIENGNNLEPSLNSVLTYLRIVEFEREKVEEEEDPEEKKAEHTHHRGSRPLLPKHFLALPRFRVISVEETECEREFKVVYCRSGNGKIGLNIDVANGVIKVTSLPTSDSNSQYLAEQSGVKEGDIIVGLGNEFFAPFPDKQDFIRLLDISKPFSTLLFLREKSYTLAGILDHSHSFTRYLWKQSMIEYASIRLVNIYLASVKAKVMNWNLQEISKRITQFAPADRKDYFLQRGSIRPGLVARILRGEYSPQTKVIRYVIWIIDVETGWEWIIKRRYREIFDFREKLMTVKPSIRVVEFPKDTNFLDNDTSLAEERIPLLQEFLVSIFKITAYNATHPSKLFLNLYLNEFLAVDANWEKIQSLIEASKTTDEIELIRDPSLPALPIPPKSNLSSQSIDGKDDDAPLPHSSSPSFSAVQSPQTFRTRSAEEYRQTYLFYQKKRKKIEYNMIRVYIQNVFLLNTFESIINNFVEEFLSHRIEDVDETTWTERKAANVLKQLTTFMSQIQRFLYEHFRESYLEILSFYHLKRLHSIIEKQTLQNENIEKQLQSLTPEEISIYRLHSYEEQEEDKEKQSEILFRHIRKQIECEIYMKCIDRIKFIVHRTLRPIEELYEKKIQVLSRLSLDYFDIPPHFLSAERWKLLIEKFQSIQYPALPTDKIELLMESLKFISILHHEQHHGHPRPRDGTRPQTSVPDPPSPPAPAATTLSASPASPTTKKGEGNKPPSIRPVEMKEEGFNLQEEAGGNDSDDSESDLILGADELLPCYVYCLIQAKIPNLIYINFELQCFVDPDRNLSEVGYCLATLEAVIQHIVEIDLTKQQKFTSPRSKKFSD